MAALGWLLNLGFAGSGVADTSVAFELDFDVYIVLDETIAVAV